MAIPIIAIALVLVQGVDTAVHLGTNQIEPMRLAANGVLSLWALWAWFGRPPAFAAMLAIVTYAALNGFYVAIHGLTNPHMGDAPRTALLGFVLLSIGLALWLRRRSEE